MPRQENNGSLELPENSEATAGTTTSSNAVTIATIEIPTSTEASSGAEMTATETTEEMAEEISTETLAETLAQISISSPEEATTNGAEETITETAEQTTSSISGETTTASADGIATEQPASPSGETVTGSDNLSTMADALHATAYIILPTTEEAIELFQAVYEAFFAPVFAHPVWANRTHGRGRSFPALVRSVMDMIDILEPDELDPAMLQDWFATFIKAFCETEMHVLEVTSEAEPGEFFDWEKYGVGCGYSFRANWRLPFWVGHLYAYRSEWAWGVHGGLRGLAGFSQAVGMFAHCFTAMLQNAWSGKGLLYRRASWELVEYLYKWALKVQPPPVPTAAAVAHQDSQAPSDQDVDSSSAHSDDSVRTVVPLTVVPLGHSSTTLGQTDRYAGSWLDLSNDSSNDEGTVRAEDDDSSDEGTIRGDDEYTGDENTEVQEPYTGCMEPFPSYTDPFPRYTEMEPPSLHVEVAFSPQHGAAQAISQATEITAMATTAPPRRGRARAQADAAERAEADDADLTWFAEYVLDQQL